MRAAAGLIIVAAWAGCAANGGSCPSDLPESCPSAPSWAQTVQPAMARTCAPCHGPGGVEAAKPLVTWQDVSNRRREVLDQVYSCLMPQEGSGLALTQIEQQALLQWLVCGAPNN